MAKKVKRDYWVEIKEMLADAEAIEFIDKEIARIDAHAAKVKEKRDEKGNEAAVAIREGAIKVLEDAERPITLAELVAGIDFEDKTPGKVTYYIRELVDNGAIIKAKAKVGDRKIMTYAIAE